MNALPPFLATQRAPRAHLEDIIPAVLRFQDGRRVPSQLQVVSSTGGLLSLPHPLAQGSQVKLMFLTGSGSVLGGAEMLTPVSSTLQPFRFLSIAQDDQRRLGAIIQAAQPRADQPQNNAEQLWIDKLRAAAPLHPEVRRGRFLKRAIGAVGVLTLGLAGALYLFHIQWP
jgi:hypothetical protein